MNRAVVCFLILLVLPLPCFAQRSTEPLNFRGIEWDTYYSAIPGMTKQYARDEKIDVFKKAGDEMAIGDRCAVNFNKILKIWTVSVYFLHPNRWRQP